MSNGGKEVKNSCKSCEFFHKGVKVAHNHCDHPYATDYMDDERVNGRGHRRKCSRWQKRRAKEKINA